MGRTWIRHDSEEVLEERIIPTFSAELFLGDLSWEQVCSLVGPAFLLQQESLSRKWSGAVGTARAHAASSRVDTL